MNWFDQLDAPAAPPAEVDWLTATEAAPPPAPRKPRTPAPAPGIPADQAWLVFRAGPPAEDSPDPNPTCLDLRVCTASELNAEGRRRLAAESRDWDHDIPLLRAPLDGEPSPRWLVTKCGGDPAAEAQAAWRLFCSEWNVTGFGRAAHEVGKIAGMEWLPAQWERGRG